MRQRPNDPGLEPRVEIYTIHGFLLRELGVDLNETLAAADWLTMTHHRLRSVVDERVFRDDLGLQSVRDRFAWYPHDIWLYVLAFCWARMGVEKTLTGRAVTSALRDQIHDPLVCAIADRWIIGSIDLFNDNHLIDDDPKLRPLLTTLSE